MPVEWRLLLICNTLLVFPPKTVDCSDWVRICEMDFPFLKTCLNTKRSSLRLRFLLATILR